MKIYVYRLALCLFFLPLTASRLLGQPEGESPYSSSESGEIDNVSAWYNSPILLVGLVLFGGVLIYIIAKGRKA